MICLRGAIEKIGWRRMNEVSFYVTLEPCAMCAGALVLCRVGALICGTADPKAGAAGSVMNVAHHPKLNHRLPVTPGVLEKLCAGLLS
jgi:tRNA(adenine34) deaminase